LAIWQALSCRSIGLGGFQFDLFYSTVGCLNGSSDGCIRCDFVDDLVLVQLRHASGSVGHTGDLGPPELCALLVGLAIGCMVLTSLGVKNYWEMSHQRYTSHVPVMYILEWKYTPRVHEGWNRN